MVRILKAVVVLTVLGFVGLAGYAYLGDMTPTSSEINKPVELNVDR